MVTLIRIFCIWMTQKWFLIAFFWEYCDTLQLAQGYTVWLFFHNSQWFQCNAVPMQCVQKPHLQSMALSCRYAVIDNKSHSRAWIKFQGINDTIQNPSAKTVTDHVGWGKSGSCDLRKLAKLKGERGNFASLLRQINTAVSLETVQERNGANLCFLMCRNISICYAHLLRCKTHLI